MVITTHQNLSTGNCFEPPLKLSLLGIWLEAERMVRNLSVRHSHVYVISGSIFDENSDGHRDADSNITRLVLRSLCLLSIVLIMLSLPTHLFAQQAGAYHGFRSMKRLGVFLLHLVGKQVHHRVTPSIKFAGTHLSGERDFEG